MGNFGQYHNHVSEIQQLPQQSLEQLERTLTASLYAVWRAQGKEKRVVEIKQANGRLTQNNKE